MDKELQEQYAHAREDDMKYHQNLKIELAMLKFPKLFAMATTKVSHSKPEWCNSYVIDEELLNGIWDYLLERPTGISKNARGLQPVAERPAW